MVQRNKSEIITANTPIKHNIVVLAIVDYLTTQQGININKMMAEIEVKQISEDIIEILGETYYKEDYLKEMMRREYERGIKEGRTVHIAEIVKIDQL